MSRTSPRPQLSTSELETLVLDVVSAAGRAVTVTDIRRAMPKALRPAAKALTGVVAALADAQRLFRIGRRFSAQPDRSLHERIVAAAGGESLTASELAKKLKAPATRVRAAIRELVDAGELHPHPKHRYGAHPPTHADLLRPELARVFAAAKKLGIREDAARAALRTLLGGGTPGNEIVDAIREMEPSGALVYLPHLRTALAASYTDKLSFDRAVLGLLSRGAVQLQSHPTPSLLGTAERDAMIEDGRGGYFSAIGLR